MSRSPPLEVRARLVRRGQNQNFCLDVELVFPPGITILFGPSGAGKTTILQTIAGLVKPDSGLVNLGDEVWCDSDLGIHRAVHRRGVAYVFQSLALFPHMTAIGNVAYGLRRDLSPRERREIALASLDKFGVSHLADRRPRTFSGGEAQRVALARALALSPRVVLLDEPFSNLDRDLRIQLAATVRRLIDELEIPLVWVTHHHGEARALGDRLIRITAGRVVEQGSVDQVLGEVGGEPQGRGRRYEGIGNMLLPAVQRHPDPDNKG